MEFQLSNTDTFEYANQHRNAMRSYSIANEDYIASRCCLLNGLLSQGYILAEQAIEKKMKSIIWILTPSMRFNDKKFRLHKLSHLIHYIHENSKIDLRHIEQLCETLSDIYEFARYPDSKISSKRSSWHFSVSIIHEVDEAFFNLIEVSPMPNEVKFVTGLYATALDTRRPHNRAQFWALNDNNAFKKRSQDLRYKHELVMNHLYPK